MRGDCGALVAGKGVHAVLVPFSNGYPHVPLRLAHTLYHCHCWHKTQTDGKMAHHHPWWRGGGVLPGGGVGAGSHYHLTLALYPLLAALLCYV